MFVHREIVSGISAHLVKGSDGTDVCAGEYDRDLQDALNLEQNISTSVASEIRIHLSFSAKTRMAKVHPIDPEAFRNYLLGRFYWNKRNEEGLLKSVTYFNQAIARDPTYARAYTGLADAYLVLGSLRERTRSSSEGHRTR